MLLPRFSIRTILVVTTACALLFVLVGTAYRGQMWAWGVTIGVFSLIVTGLVHAACFGVVWFFARSRSEAWGDEPRPATRVASDAAK